jgi:hypothetical protein
VGVSVSVGVGEGVSVGVGDGVAVSVAVGVGVSVAVAVGNSVSVAIGELAAGRIGDGMGRAGEGVTIGGVNPGNSAPKVGVGNIKVGSPLLVGVGEALAPLPGRCRMKSAAKPIR